MAYLEFEAIGIPRVKTERSVAYIDHNTLQNGFENADDHRFIRTSQKSTAFTFRVRATESAIRYTLNGSEFPVRRLIGSDSHTPTGGGIGMFAMGAGGMDVAVAMGGGEYHINMPEVGIKVNLTGKLRDYVAAKDIILEVLRVLSVKGGVGRDHRIRRRGRQNPDRSRARHHNQHGRRARCHHINLPCRRGHEKNF